jgi:hypothetical protein
MILTGERNHSLYACRPVSYSHITSCRYLPTFQNIPVPLQRDAALWVSVRTGLRGLARDRLVLLPIVFDDILGPLEAPPFSDESNGRLSSSDIKPREPSEALFLLRHHHSDHEAS